MAKGLKQSAVAVWHFYRDAFRNMTWGRTLVWLILLKFFILFAILRVFFFKPAMAGLDEAERSRVVGERLVGGSQTETETPASPSQTYNL
jgi:hypothetical protein